MDNAQLEVLSIEITNLRNQMKLHIFQGEASKRKMTELRRQGSNLVEKVVEDAIRGRCDSVAPLAQYVKLEDEPMSPATIIATRLAGSGNPELAAEFCVSLFGSDTALWGEPLEPVLDLINQSSRARMMIQRS